MESIVDMRQQRPDGEIASLQADLRNLITSLQDHRMNVSSKLNDLDGKFEAMRRDQARAVDELESKLMQLFVLRAEYDPKHQVVLDKIHEYDRIIDDSRKAQDEYVTIKNMVRDHDEEIRNIKTRAAGTAQRILPWIGLAGSMAALLLNFAQHIHLTP